MKASLRLDKALHFIGKTEAGLEVGYDTSVEGGGLNSAPSPVENVAMAVAACTSMDVVAIVKKRRKEIIDYRVDINYERAAEHPKVITKLHLSFFVTSPDLTDDELRHAIELSHEKYCTVSIMVSRSGTEITWEAHIARP